MNPFLVALLLLPGVAFPRATVSLDARGQDVREVLATLFAQAKKPYALDAAIRGTLYLRFEGRPYDKALEVVTRQAGLVAREVDGIVLVSLANPPKAEAKPAPPEAPAKRAPPRPSPTMVLARRVTTRLSRTPLAEVFASFGKQAGVTFDVDSKVPAYRIDATFANATLRSALDQICKATGLRYGFDHGRIRVVKR